MRPTFLYAAFAAALSLGPSAVVADGPVCVDNLKFELTVGGMLKKNACKTYVAKDINDRCVDEKVLANCVHTCGQCDCIDDPAFFFKVAKKKCDWVAQNDKCEKKVKFVGAVRNRAKDHCRIACGTCVLDRGLPEDESGSLNPFIDADVPPGWIGGFAQSHPDFAYPAPDLSSLEVTTNMDNIDKLTRMQKVKWPEFSWEMVPGRDNTRVYTTFTEYISRLGYDNEGRIWSIICPQQGIGSAIGDFNFEVTVTGVRGWEDETARSTAADMSVVGQVWFTANNRQDGNSWFRFLLSFLAGSTDLPFSKSNAIQVLTNVPGDPNEPLFNLKDGIDPAYDVPPFKTHWDDGAYANIYLQAQIGRIRPRAGQSQLVTAFNELIVTLFNFGSGNLLQFQNILSWNIWLEGPKIVNQTEWQNHAELWRDSLNNNNRYPGEDQGHSGQFYFDGTEASLTGWRNIRAQLARIRSFIWGQFTKEQVDEKVKAMYMDKSFSKSDEDEIMSILFDGPP